jgi:hypothetical protein
MIQLFGGVKVLIHNGAPQKTLIAAGRLKFNRPTAMSVF